MAKSLLVKNKNKDQFLALLDFRNTPTEATGTSPAQRLLNRRTRTLLPTSETLLRPKVHLDVDKVKLHASQRKQAKTYNEHAKPLPPLEEGDVVRMKPFQMQKKWSKGIVIKRLDERSYEVETDNGNYRRNRVHLKKTEEPPPGNEEADFHDSGQETPGPDLDPKPGDVAPTPAAARPQRLCQRPAWMKDYVTG